MALTADSTVAPAGRRVSEWFWALLVAGISLGVYVRTAFPDMLGNGDTPKFQYLGRLLGTAHNPGYPLYILVSHVFSFVPVGTVAYRMNLLSSVAGALSAGVLYVVMRQLRCSRPVGAIMALAFAFGRMYWAQATFAEVYTMAALLLAAFVAVLFRWGRQAAETRRWRDLMIAVGISALALGHHLTITLVAPGAVVYALLVDRRQALQPKTVIIGALLVACGLAQYGFIVVRTLQHAPHVESHAASIGELVDVVRGAQFASHYLGRDVRDVAQVRTPQVAEIGFREAGLVGAVLAGVGLVAMFWRLPREAAFLLIGIGFNVLFAVTYDVPDSDVFMVPAFVLAWPVAACGLQALVSASWGRWRAAVLVAAALLVPGRQLVANYAFNDHHRRYIDGRRVRGILSQIPDRSAIVSESYTFDAMVTYALEVEHIGGAKHIVQIPSERDAIRAALGRGLAVYAFDRSRELLQERGVGFVSVPFVTQEGGRYRVADVGVYRVTEARLCADIGNLGWVDITGLARGGAGRIAFRIDNYRPFETTAVLYVESARPLRPTVSNVQGTGEPTLSVGRFENRAEADAIGRAMARRGQAATAGAVVSRIELALNDRGNFCSFVLALGESPSRVWAEVTVDRNNARRATLCEDPLGRTEVPAARGPIGGVDGTGRRGAVKTRE